MKEVYLLESKFGEGTYLKIGKTKNIKQRLPNIQTGNPDAVLVGFLKVENADVLEKELHVKFKELAYKGEWFKYSKEIIDYFETHELFCKEKVKNFEEKKIRKRRPTRFYMDLVKEYLDSLDNKENCPKKKQRKEDLEFCIPEWPEMIEAVGVDKFKIINHADIDELGHIFKLMHENRLKKDLTNWIKSIVPEEEEEFIYYEDGGLSFC